MCCFSAPAGAALIILRFKKIIPKKYHINWLISLLWGGVLGLVVEHVAHGEIVPFFPYITAMSTPEDTLIMAQEILTVGGAMLLACTAIWLLLVGVLQMHQKYFVSKIKHVV